jgi:hypothetical protein
MALNSVIIATINSGGADYIVVEEYSVRNIL